MKGVFRIVNIRTMQIVYIGCSRNITEYTLQKTCYRIKYLYHLTDLPITDYVLDVFQNERFWETEADWNRCLNDKRWLVMRYRPYYNLMAEDECRPFSPLPLQDEIKWKVFQSYKDAFCQRENIFLIMEQLQMKKEEMQNILDVRHALCEYINLQMQNQIQ